MSIRTRLVVAAEREVFALRVAFEAVVGQNAPQVRVPAEVDAVHVEHLIEQRGETKR